MYYYCHSHKLTDMHNCILTPLDLDILSWFFGLPALSVSNNRDWLISVTDLYTYLLTCKWYLLGPCWTGYWLKDSSIFDLVSILVTVAILLTYDLWERPPFLSFSTQPNKFWICVCHYAIFSTCSHDVWSTYAIGVHYPIVYNSLGLFHS